MPFALLIIGVVLVTAGVRNSQDQLFALVRGDFTGQNNFIYWFVAIMIVGLVGYVPKLKPLSNAFLVLLIVVLFLSKGNPSGVGGGFFQKFFAALQSTNSGNLTGSATNLTSAIGNSVSTATNTTISI